MQVSTQHCKNCNNQFSGHYCNQCGEKVYTRHDKSLKHIFEEVFHFATHFEGSLFTTLKVFLTRPGRYATDYCAGIRKKYFKPISFFLVLVVLYLLFPLFQGLDMKLQAYVSKETDSNWYAQPIAKKKMEQRHISLEQLAENYNKKSPSIAKLFLLTLIPLSALALSVLFYTSRRYYFDHVIIATEIISFYIFLQYLLMPLLAILTVAIFPSLKSIFNDGSWVWKIFLILLVIYFSIAFRAFYQQNHWLGILKAIIFFFVFFILIRKLYNFLLYYLVMLFI